MGGATVVLLSAGNAHTCEQRFLDTGKKLNKKKKTIRAIKKMRMQTNCAGSSQKKSKRNIKSAGGRKRTARSCWGETYA